MQDLAMIPSLTIGSDRQEAPSKLLTISLQHGSEK